MRVLFVHGACVRDGAWWWHLAAAALPERGIASSAPALPSCGEAGRPPGPTGPGLPEDVDAVRASLLVGDEPTVVVAHSYGGIVTADAAAGVDSVRLSVTQHPVGAAAWHDVPTTYLVCADDRGTPATAQREFARRADKVHEIAAD